MHSFRVVVSVITVLISLPRDSSAGQTTKSVSIENHKTGSTVRYSVVLLRGRLPADSKQLRIENKHAPKGSGPIHPVVYKGRFKAIVELNEGINKLSIIADGADDVEFELMYLPQTNPHYVRLVWMTDRSGDTRYATPSNDKDAPQNYEDRLRTAALLMQTFTAEKMHDLGYGHRTFRLERDKNGKVIVHTWKGPESREAYYAMGGGGIVSVDGSTESIGIGWRRTLYWLRILGRIRGLEK